MSLTRTILVLHKFLFFCFNFILKKFKKTRINYVYRTSSGLFFPSTLKISVRYIELTNNPCFM